MRTPADLQPNLHVSDLRPGDLILFHSASWKEPDHIGVYQGRVNGRLVNDEANYKKCQQTTRLLEPSDPTIRGYYRAPVIPSVNLGT